MEAYKTGMATEYHELKERTDKRVDTGLEGRMNRMTELKPCPFCGVMPHIYWEAWKDISPDAGVWKLKANHKDSCYFTHINGKNISGRSSARRLSQLVEWWNHREETE